MTSSKKISEQRVRIGNTIESLLTDIAGERVGFGLIVVYQDREDLNTFIANTQIEDIEDALVALLETIQTKNR